MALSCLATLINPEIFLTLKPKLLALVEHKDANVRKKLWVVLKRVVQLDNSFFMEIEPLLKNALKDPEPCVMGTLSPLQPN